MQKTLPKLAYLLMFVLLVLGIWGFDVMSLADTAMVAITTSTSSNPLAEISVQEPAGPFILRTVLLFLAGLVAAVGIAKPGDKTEFATHDEIRRDLIIVGVLLIATSSPASWFIRLDLPTFGCPTSTT